MKDLKTTYALLYYCDGGWQVYHEAELLANVLIKVLECTSNMATKEIRVIEVIPHSVVSTRLGDE